MSLLNWTMGTDRVRIRLLVMAALALCVGLTSQPAFAQDDDAEVAKEEAAGDADAPEADSDRPEADADGPGAPPSLDEDVGESAVEERLDAYWSVDRDLATVQDRLFEREGRFGLGLYTGLMSSEPFYYYYPVGGRLSYFFSNQFGLELEGSFTDAGPFTHDTELTTFLETARGDAFDKSIHTHDRFLWRGHALLVWHPLYGKLAFLQRKLTHFDFNLVAGAGAVGVERPNEFRTEAESAVEAEFVFGGGVQFFATSDLVVRLEGRGYVYRGPMLAEGDTFFDRLTLPTEFLLGASYMF
jgi:outer membrane beta-barrel protein